jgi:hypothetical protein
MKTLKLIGLLTLVIIDFTSCDKIFDRHEPEFVVYNLDLSLRDTSGNDLVKGIGLGEWIPGNIPEEQAQSGSLKDDLYVLDIIVSEPCWNWDNNIYNAPARPGFEPSVNRPELGIERYNGACYLRNSFRLPVNDCPEEKILTYKLKCPYVFGDDAVHEFVTYWDIPKSNYAHTFERFAKCNRIEFEGNEITPTPMDKNEQSYAATIIIRK